MNPEYDDRLAGLLMQADRAWSAEESPDAAAMVRGVGRRLRRRRRVQAAGLAVAGVALALCSAQALHLHEQRRIAALQEQVRQLNEESRATLQLVREVLAEQREIDRLAALRGRLAAVPNPLREMDRQIDQAAFTMLYQADLLYRELKMTDSAVDSYKQLIRLFPDNRWAQVARERLEEIESNDTHTQEEGDLS